MNMSITVNPMIHILMELFFSKQIRNFSEQSSEDAERQKALPNGDLFQTLHHSKVLAPMILLQCASQRTELNRAIEFLFLFQFLEFIPYA